jgi:hypothetical protein
MLRLIKISRAPNGRLSAYTPASPRTIVRIEVRCGCALSVSVVIFCGNKFFSPRTCASGASGEIWRPFLISDSSRQPSAKSGSLSCDPFVVR